MHMKKRSLILSGLTLLAVTWPTLADDAQQLPTPPAESAAPAPAKIKGALTSSDPSQRAEWQKRLTLGAGDTLNFALFDRPDSAKRDVAIGPDGRVSFLQAEDVLAAGLTIDELRAAFDAELSKFYNTPRTIITPAAYNSKKFYLLGAVSQKGVFTLNRPTTMIEAIARAGGLETGLFDQNTVELADLSHSFMVRHGERLAVDFESLFQRGDLSQNIAIEPDDYIFFASSAANQIFVVGAVGPGLGDGTGVVPYSPNASLISAITSRGGFADKAYQSRVLIVRGSLNKPECIVVNAKAILAGEAPDFRLEPKDIVYVSRRPWARAEEILDNATIAFIQSAVVTYTGFLHPLIQHPWVTP